MCRHLPWRNRTTLSPHRVMWPMTMASQMSRDSSPVVAWRTAQMPSGTTTCDTMEM